MTDTATRRALLAGLAAAPVAAVPVAASEPNDLAHFHEPAVRARQVVQAADAAIDELFDRHGAAAWNRPELVDAEAGRKEALDMLARTRAHTMEGLAAKAEVLLGLPYGDREHRDALGVSLSRDVLAMRTELAV